MQKFLLYSVLFANIVIPLWTATNTSPTRGFRRMVFSMLAFNLFYVFAIIYVLPRLPA
jgi:hypothetical protein